MVSLTKEAAMNVEQERSRSVWMEIPAPDLPRLTGGADADVLIVGAGIAGLSTAYLLSQAGRRVTVVDRGRFGRGMSARTSAHLSFELDDFFHELTKAHGEEAARDWYSSQSAAVDLFERIALEEAIECDFARVDGVFTAAEDKDVDYLRRELESAHAAGYGDAEWLEAGAFPGMERAGIRFPRQARFHPVKFLNGLVEALRRRGAGLFQDTDVVKLEEKDGAVLATTGDDDVIRARQVVVATNSPFHLMIPIHTKQAPYRTYVIAAPIPKGAAADVLLWDTLEPAYHYVRLKSGEDEDLLIVGGEDHKSGTADDGDARIRRLETWARARWPQMGKVAYAWSGQVMEPADYVGFIGRSPEHEEVYVVTGDSGQGLTTAGAAALILADLMNDRQNPWADLYNPSRQMHRGLGEYLKENLEAAKHWLELAGPGELKSVDEIARGDGAVLKIHGKPVAAYRDETGELHLNSAICTHAGCTVHWNGFETCWDCPCHGSQFDLDGQVLAGPAARNLSPIAQDEDRRREVRSGEAPEARP
jgi:glycine/D-amino acid oxidase-like deaminating enzyme/nitrite reductase/ring-hydroxylating ferredoxin subunit